MSESQPDTFSQLGRATCIGCCRPSSVCVCEHVTPLRTRTRILVLQHPREERVPVNTVRLAELSLPSLQRHVGVEFSGSAAVRAALNDGAAPAILLYPGEGARDLAHQPPEGPVTLVVIDGTWWQAGKVLKQNPELQRLPRYTIEPAEPSRYRIRREPARHCLSTIEAIVQALEHLEGDAPNLSAALRPFDAMVEQQLSFAQRRQRRHITRKRSPAPRPLALLHARSDDLVVAYGEANAWPRNSPLGARAEVVHWAALRIASGERFEAFIVPEHPMAPSFSHHTGLSVERVLAGESFEAFNSRWQAFLRPSDMLCGWGGFAAGLLKARGAPIPVQLDLRLTARQVLRARTGDVQACAVLLAAELLVPWVPGRTGARLSALASVTRALSSRGALPAEGATTVNGSTERARSQDG